eukprot:12217327-Alexandrium_andersonii.AAC.1
MGSDRSGRYTSNTWGTSALSSVTSTAERFPSSWSLSAGLEWTERLRVVGVIASGPLHCAGCASRKRCGP